MQGMFGRALSWLVGFFQGLIGLVLPLFSPASVQRMSRVLFLVLHVAFVIGIIVGLWFINWYFKFGQSLRIQSEILASLWLPIIFILFYVICWLSWWLGKLLIFEEEASNFPDIDEAWNAAV